MSQASEGDGSVQNPAQAASGGQALLSADSRSASGAGSGVAPVQMADIKAFQLNVYSAAGGAGATLDVWVQHCLDGTNWDDVVHFHQVLGNSGGVSEIATMTVRQRDQAAEMHLLRDGTLGAGQVVDSMLGRCFRAKWVIAGGGTFGFQVLAF